MPVSAALVVNFRFKNKYYKDMAKTIKPTKMLLYIERLKGYYSLLFYMMIYSANRSSNSICGTTAQRIKLHTFVWCIIGLHYICYYILLDHL